MSQPRVLLLLIIFWTVASSCKKENRVAIEPKAYGKLAISITHQVNTSALQFDTFMYQNAAGNKYSITRFNYYISDVCLTKTDQSKVKFKDVIYVDASALNIFTLQNVPVAEYRLISFSIGVDSSQNKAGSLPTTMENVNMVWPEEMGGGYHFLKLEGHYKNSVNVEKGYTMHLGTNPILINHNELSMERMITNDQTTTVKMIMNVDEWFKNPYSYNFNTDGNYTMGNAALMKLISDNGKDVFQIQ